MIRIWKVVHKNDKAKKFPLIMLKDKSNAELYMELKSERLDLELIPVDVNELELPPWSWIITMSEEKECEGVLSNWDNFTDNYVFEPEFAYGLSTEKINDLKSRYPLVAKVLEKHIQKGEQK